MDIENEYLMQIYQVLMSIRDSVEYALVGVECKPNIFYLRKEILENGIKNGPLVSIMQTKGPLGDSVKKTLYSLYEDLYVKGRYLKVEDDKVTKFDDSVNSEVIERLVGNYTVVEQILEINRVELKKEGKLNPLLDELLSANNEYYAIMYLYALFINIIEERAKSLMEGEIDLTKNENLTRIMSVYMFFKNKLKTTDQDIQKCINSVDTDIDLIGQGEIGDDLINNLEISYHLLEEHLKLKQIKWQECYKNVIDSMSK